MSSLIPCIKCDTTKPITDFYKSTIRKSGKGECKTCVKSRVHEHREDNIEYIRAYDRKRGNLPHRVEARKEYAQTDQGKKAFIRANRHYRSRNPERYQAHNMVNNAVRDGKLIKPNQCEECGVACNPHGHHSDYNKPLEVDWLCEPCHKAWHRDNTPIYVSEVG